MNALTLHFGLLTVMIARFFNPPLFFSRSEWWYYVLTMPVLLPLANYYFIGLDYFHDCPLFLTGTALTLGLYWLTVILLRVAVHWVVNQFDDVEQAVTRTLVMLLIVAVLITGLAIISVWAYSTVPATGVQFTWEAVRPLWVLGFLFDVVLCIVLSMKQTYAQWQQDQTESEQLKRITMQHQLNALKGQINPHFLFNSLNSLSSLIGEDSARAEQFVDDLSKVYRYMLQAGNRELVTLQEELTFTTTYVDLLQTRYGGSLRIEYRVDPDYLIRMLPPLSLQILIDNAIKHNIMLPGKPLLLDVRTTPFGLRVRNNIQRKTLRVEAQQAGLSSLMAKYRLLGDESVRVQETGECFSVTLPLLPAFMNYAA